MANDGGRVARVETMTVTNSEVMPFKGRKRAFRLIAVSMLALAAACASPEQKVERYSQEGAEFLEEGDLPKAYIQFQNALKIDEAHVPSLIGLAEIAEERKDFQALFGILQNIVRLDAAQIDDQRVVDENPEIVVTGEFECFTALIGEGVVKFECEMIIVYSALITE